ncbi:MAG: molecular chaperone DnaJ [Armatimonadota bacterium]
MRQDYYHVLGVSRDCTQDEIRRAYRRLARRYHPDVCREEGAEEQFKRISEAYAVLSDPQKRRRYDLYGEAPGVGVGGPVDLFDLFDQVFGGGMGRPFGFRTEARGADLQHEVTIDLADVVEGVEVEVEVARQAECETCGGSGAEPGSSPETCPRCGGRGYVTHERRTFLGVMATTSPCSECGGHGTVVRNPCPECRGYGVVRARQTVLVSIPPGIQDGQRIRMPGHGDVPPGGGIPGDLLVRVRVRRHPLFTRHERELHMPLQISFSQAALGDEVTVPTIDGTAQVLIRPGTQSGETIELPGKGLPPLHGGARGRQVIEVHVATPTDLDEEQRRLLIELALRRGEDIHPPEHVGLLERLRKVFSGEG